MCGQNYRVNKTEYLTEVGYYTITFYNALWY